MYSHDFYFTIRDVQANRQGKLTANQENLVESIYQFRQRGVRQTVIAFIILFVVMMVVGAGIELSKWEGTFNEFVNEMGPIFLMFSGIFAAMLTISAISGVLVAQDTKHRRISVAEGRATLFSGMIYGRYMRYQLILSRGFFKTATFRFASEKPLRQFIEGRRYRVYYIKFYPLPIILSAEELD
jgi:hypothetical protein